MEEFCMVASNHREIFVVLLSAYVLLTGFIIYRILVKDHPS
jgi:hypothetical protein